MISLQEETKIHIAAEPIDMRKAIDGLSALVVEVLEQDPQSGHVFVFRNKRSNKVKALYWDRNGFCMWLKRLEKDRFPWPKDEMESKEITVKEFRMLLEGIDYFNAHKKLKYSSVT